MDALNVTLFWIGFAVLAVTIWWKWLTTDDDYENDPIYNYDGDLIKHNHQVKGIFLSDKVYWFINQKKKRAETWDKKKLERIPHLDIWLVENKELENEKTKGD